MVINPSVCRGGKWAAQSDDGFCSSASAGEGARREPLVRSIVARAPQPSLAGLGPAPIRLWGPARLYPDQSHGEGTVGYWSIEPTPFRTPKALRQTTEMVDVDRVWERILANAGHEFTTKTGRPFTYVVPGDYLRVTRDGKQINRSLSRTNFAKATLAMPADGPGELADRQGPSYTWAILMDPRVRDGDW